MSLDTFGLNGHYDENGNWQRTKFCFMYCGQRCDCGPPGGLHYSALHDQRLRKGKPTDGSGVALGDKEMSQANVRADIDRTGGEP